MQLKRDNVRSGVSAGDKMGGECERYERVRMNKCKKILQKGKNGRGVGDVRSGRNVR
jgi:hypothetical protein